MATCVGGQCGTGPASSGTSCTEDGGAACDGSGSCARAVVVVRVGDGSAALTSAATPVFLEEHFLSDGSLVPRGARNPLPLPTAASGSNAQLTLSGTATSEGALALSVDGRYVTLAGYGADAGTTGVVGTTSATVNRIAGRVDAGFAVDTSTRINALISGNNPRSAVTTDGTLFWVGGAANGVVALPFGTTGGTAIITAATLANVRVVDIFGGQLYGSSSSKTFTNVYTIGSGLPTTAGQTPVSLAGMPTSGPSPYGFVFFDLDPAIPGFDRLYVADDTAGTGGVQRWKYDATQSKWVLSATLNQFTSGGTTTTQSFRGVTGFVSNGTTVTLIATVAATTAKPDANALVVFVDDGSATVPTGVQIAAAPTNTAFRGIALPPQ